MELEQMSLNQLCELARKQEQALTDSNASLMEQTELAERCRKQAETLEAELLVARAACDAQGELTQKYQAFALASAQSPTIKQLAAQLDSNEKWTIAEQKAFAPFLAQFPNESSQGILSLGSAWKHGIAYAQSLAAAPQQHAQAALSDEFLWKVHGALKDEGYRVFAHTIADALASQPPAAAPRIHLESIDTAEFRELVNAHHCAKQNELEAAYDAIVYHVDEDVSEQVRKQGVLPAIPRQPAAAPTGHTEVDKMLETNPLDELGEEVARLQKALCFWLPSVTDREDEVALRILDDAFLLVGIDGNLPDDFKSAQELGWVSLNPAPADTSAERTQWKNINHVLREVAKFCFESKDHPQYGAAYTAVVTCLSAKDGLQVTLDPLPSAAPAIQQEGAPDSPNLKGNSPVVPVAAITVTMGNSPATKIASASDNLVGLQQEWTALDDDRSVRTESPPEFYKYNPSGLEGMGDRSMLWDYGQLVGWRFGMQQARAALAAPVQPTQGEALSQRAEDSRLLDWLEANCATLTRLHDNSGYILSVNGLARSTGKTSRAALRAINKQEPTA